MCNNTHYMSTSFLFYFFFKSQAVLTETGHSKPAESAPGWDGAILTGVLLLQMPLVIYGEL